MSEEELLRKLEEAKKQKEKAYTELKGMIKGMRLGERHKIEKSFLDIIQFLLDGFKNVWEDIFMVLEQQIRDTQKINNLEKEVEQLKATLDKLSEWR